MKTVIVIGRPNGAVTGRVGGNPTLNQATWSRLPPGLQTRWRPVGNRWQDAAMTESPYLFPAADHPLTQATDRLQVREAVSGFGIALRYQERAPGGGEADWCLTGHSIFILSGRIRYRFDSHTVEAGPGDMLHIPAGPAHRHKNSVVGDEPVRYVLTEFN